MPDTQLASSKHKNSRVDFAMIGASAVFAALSAALVVICFANGWWVVMASAVLSCVANVINIKTGLLILDTAKSIAVIRGITR